MSTRPCPNCGAPQGAQRTFCNNCGANLPRAPQPGRAPRAGMPAGQRMRFGFGLVATVGAIVAAMVLVSALAFLFLIGPLANAMAGIDRELIGTATAIAETAGPVTQITAAPRPSPPPTPDATATVASERAAAVTATAEAAVATSTALQTTARQVFRDEFDDNRNAWFTGRLNQQEINTIADGVLRIAWYAEASSYELYTLQELTDFSAEVDCTVVRGVADASCGIVFAQQPDIGYYQYELFNDYFRLGRYYLGEWELLVEGNPQAALQPGAANRLRVERSGGLTRLFLNDQYLGSSADTAMPTGRVGIASGAYNPQGGVEVWFDNFTIWELPAS